MSKKSLTISLVIITILFVCFVLWHFVFSNEIKRSDNQLVNKLEKTRDNCLIYSVEEYEDENSFITVFYAYDLSTGKTNKLFQLDEFKDYNLGQTIVVDDSIFFVSILHRGRMRLCPQIKH